MSNAIIIIGAGQIGRAVAAVYLDLGWRVTLIAHGSRAPDGSLVERGARFKVADRNDMLSLSRCLDSGATVLVDTIAFNAEHASQLLDIQCTVDAISIISSASVYQDGLGRTLDEANGLGADAYPHFASPISEDQRTVEPGVDTYSTRKIALERLLLEGATVPVSVIRPCAVYGIATRQPREWWFIKRALDRRKNVPLAFQGRSRFQTSCTVNIAEVIRAATSSRFHGVVNAGDKSTPSVLEIGLAIGKIMNWEWSFTLLPDEADISAGGESPWSVPYPFLLDMTRARSLGYVETTTYEDYLTSYCRWMVGVSASGDWKAEFCDLSDSLFDYAAEDTVVSRHSGAL